MQMEIVYLSNNHESAIGDDGKNDVAYELALIYNLPEESIVNVQVKLLGSMVWNQILLRRKTYREPRKNN